MRNIKHFDLKFFQFRTYIHYKLRCRLNIVHHIICQA